MRNWENKGMDALDVYTKINIKDYLARPVVKKDYT